MDRQSVYSNASGKRVVPTTTTTRTTSVIPVNKDGTVTAAKQEEWSTSKKVVNHKTKEVETRVQRQIIMEDGKEIADSGPQVTTKTKENQKQEESEDSNHKNVGDIDMPPGPGYVAVPGGYQMVSEKTETHQSSKEAKEENMQYHDESFKELTGLDIHRKALQAPNELINIDSDDSPDRPKGKLVHYSSKSHKINDNEEVKETSRLGRDGKMSTETSRTHHHEEFDDDEVPEDNPTQFKALPEASETTRKVEYLKDYDQGFDNFSKAMNRQNVRAIETEKHSNDYNREVSQKDYRHREEKNTSTTGRWLNDHFGDSDESDIVETSRTRTGDNVISVSRMGRTSTPISAISGDFHSVERSKKRSQKVTKSPQKYTTTATYYVKDSRSPTPDYNRPGSQVKGNASVQASLSDDEQRFSDFKSYEKRDNKVSDYRSETPNRPEKTFYFGEDDYQRKEQRTDRQIINEYLSKQRMTEKESKDTRKSDLNNNEDWKGSGYVSANVSSRHRSAVNDRVVDDSAISNNFERSFNDKKEREDIDANLNRFMDWDNHYKSLRFEDDSHWKSSNTNEYIHPVIKDDGYSSRRDPSLRQRNFDSYVSPPPLYSSNGDYGYGRSPSHQSSYRPRSPVSPSYSPTGTWTKSRTGSPSYRRNDIPDFSPLSINPSQIKSFTDSYAKTGY